MQRFLFAILVLASVTLHGAAPIPTLDELERRAPKDDTPPAVVQKFQADIARVVESNTLGTGEDFFRAANLAAYGESDFRAARVYYELLLVAVAKENRDAEKQLPQGWDTLLIALGRPMRLDVNGNVALNPDSDYFTVEPAPRIISATLKSPAKARATAEKAKDNAEMKAIVDADQAVREKDWSKLTLDERKAIGAGDRARNQRAREIVQAGELRTANDFANASLVMQHSSKFAGYQLAHELAVCSMLLGHPNFGRWLVAATYDRMLNSVGHDQRFGTQHGSAGLMRVDEAGICDAERVALGCSSLSGTLGNQLVRTAEDLLAGKKFDEAEPVARDSMIRRAKAYGARDWRVFSAQRVLGASLLGQKKYAEAETALLEAYAGLKASETSIAAASKIRIRETADYLCQLYEATAQPEKAREWKQRAAEAPAK